MSAPRKYELTDDTRTLLTGVVVHRIRRISDGMLGGWIQTEANLSHDGTCWVADDAVVSGRACVTCRSVVSGRARVSEHARVTGGSRIAEDAMVRGRASVSRHALICGRADVAGDESVFGVVRR